MKSQANSWNKAELKIYILLLCANADFQETPDEINTIKSKVDTQVFDKIHKEFEQDTEDERLEKIENAIHNHEFSTMELMALRKEIHAIFMMDNKLKMKESNMEAILDNILY